MQRREALRRVGALLGAAVAAPALIVVLNDARRWSTTSDKTWQSRTLTAAQTELVAVIAEHILPATDTPGARETGVHRFIDVMLSDYYSARDRSWFLSGLRELDARATNLFGKVFVICSPTSQLELLTALDNETFSARPATGALWSFLGWDSSSQRMLQWFWRRMKELTLIGYYTSRAGVATELGLNPREKWCDDPIFSGRPTCATESAEVPHKT